MPEAEVYTDQGRQWGCIEGIDVSFEGTITHNGALMDAFDALLSLVDWDYLDPQDVTYLFLDALEEAQSLARSGSSCIVEGSSTSPGALHEPSQS